MQLSKALLSLTMIVAVAACGGGDGGSTTPTPTAASISISPGATGAFVSITETRTATAQVRDASQAILANATVTWTTSNAAVATVSGSGSSATITATGNGSATITASSGSVQATLAVDVAQRLATVTLTPAAPALGIGATATLAPSARDARNSPISGVTGTTFTTSDRSKALVDAAGVVTAISPGSSTITASLTRDGVTATVNAVVTVSAPAPVASSASVAAAGNNVFAPATVTIGLGGSVAWTFTVDHNVLFSGSGGPADIPTRSTGTVSRQFNSLGTFNYTCSLHAGMNGVVNVTTPSIFAVMNGANERPTANSSTASGAAVITRNGTTATYTVAYQGVLTAPSGLHIHAPATTAVTAGIVVDLAPTPLTATSGVATGTFTAANIRSIGGQPPITMDSLFVLLQTGNAYVNLHTSAFPGGEIRGQTGVP